MIVKSIDCRKRPVLLATSKTRLKIFLAEEWNRAGWQRLMPGNLDKLCAPSMRARSLWYSQAEAVDSGSWYSHPRW